MMPQDELSVETSAETRQDHEAEDMVDEETPLLSINLKDKININDPALKASLEEAIFGYGLTGDLYGEDLLDLVELVIPVSSLGRVSDLSGIEYAINLEYLSMPGHEITDLSKLSSLSKLKDISANNRR